MFNSRDVFSEVSVSLKTSLLGRVLGPAQSSHPVQAKGRAAGFMAALRLADHIIHNLCVCEAVFACMRVHGM